MEASAPPGRGSYSKLREIGQGSYGKALLVQDREQRLYVMKVIDMSRMDGKMRKDAVNEVKVLSSLKHPYIVSYRESFTENRQLAIVMDYAEGGDLHQRIQRTRQEGKQIQETRVVRWFTEATLALKYMHDKHVLHRDLKSQNLFLTAHDRLRVGDFGISKVLENTAAFARTTIGTPYYLSPEICMEQPYSFGCDIWALGCVLYEMCALRVPFDAPNLQSLVQKITRGPAPVLPGYCSVDLRQLCVDLLHREQLQRPSAPDVLQRPLIQAEIRRMLREEQAKGHSQASSDQKGVVRRRQSSEPPTRAPTRQPSVDSVDQLSARRDGRETRENGREMLPRPDGADRGVDRGSDRGDRGTERGAGAPRPPPKDVRDIRGFGGLPAAPAPARRESPGGRSRHGTPGVMKNPLRY